MKNKLTQARTSRSFFSSLSSLALALVIAAVASSSSLAASDIFIKWGNAPGESRDAAFAGADGWNEINSFSWAVEATTSWTQGGGASVGKPNPGAFTITKRFDASSPTFLSMITTGKAAPTAEVVLRHAGLSGKEAQTPYLRYEFTGGFVTSITPSANSGDDGVYETITFVFKTLKMTYRPLLANGALGTPIVYSWDIPAGTATTL